MAEHGKVAGKKKEFIPPKLTRYGALEKITMGSPLGKSGKGAAYFTGLGSNKDLGWL